MSSASGHQSRFVCPRLSPVNGHLPALSSVFASIIASSGGLRVFDSNSLLSASYQKTRF